MKIRLQDRFRHLHKIHSGDGKITIPAFSEWRVVGIFGDTIEMQGDGLHTNSDDYIILSRENVDRAMVKI